jgi:hypothetical protein
VPAQSPVSQQVTVAEREEEQQGATEMVHHMVAYRHSEEAPIPAWVLGLVLIAVTGGIGTYRRRPGELAYSDQSARPYEPDRQRTRW